MPRAIVGQGDDPEIFDLIALETSSAGAVGEFEDLTRQEFRDECNIRLLLEKFGVDAFTRVKGNRELRYGVTVDDSVDLMAAYAAADEIAGLYGRAPELFKKAYPSLQALMAALADGAVDPSLWRSEAPVEPPAAPAAPSGGASAPPSAPSV